MMNYKRCVRKNQRSLFEYLDIDRDNRMTQQCLLSGLSRLQHNYTLTDFSKENHEGEKGVALFVIAKIFKSTP
jgi:hypothetical protein